MKGLEGVEDVLPLTPLQQGMLFHTLYTPESPVYNLQVELALEGDLDEVALEKAWLTLVERHTALRTSFVWERVERPYQVVLHHAPLQIERHDWRTLNGAEQDERRRTCLEENRTRLFDLAKPPLMRLTVIVLSDREFRLVWTFHHIVLEGWSAAIILGEFWKCYGDLCVHRSPELPAVRPYREFVDWLQQQDQGAAEAYWREKLKGFGAPTRLAIDRSIGDAIAEVRSVDSCRMTLPKSASDALRSLARAHRVTLNTVVQGAWSILLSRYSREQDVVYGAVLSGRPADLPDVESIVGLFVNTLPARVNVDGDAKLIPWLQALQLDQVAMRQYEYSSLLQVRAWSDVPGGQPLFHTALAFQNWLGDFPSGQIAPRLQVSVLDSRYVSDLPLMMYVVVGEALRFDLVYDVERFGRATVDRMLAHCRMLLQAMVADPEQRVSELPLLTDAERHRILVEWNDTTAEYPPKARLHDLFEAQEARAPARTAVKFGAATLSYAQLEARANQLAHVLRGCGVGRGQRVGVCVERGMDMVAAVLGILKAGAAYVPLDPMFPEERLRFMADDAELALLVSTSALAGVFGLPRERQLLLDTGTANLAAQSDRRLTQDAVLDARAEDPAYIIYTSGSTGKPKGVVVPHGAVVNFLTSMARQPGLAADDVLVAVTTLSFDIAVLELQLPLTLGATVVIASRDEAIDGRALKSVLEQSRATVMQATPVTWRLLLEAGWQGRTGFKALVGGEALPKDLADQLIARGVEVWNLYGPTETTVWSTCARIADTAKGISIGRPIANTTVYVLDGQNDLCPIGIPGELCIGGDGVTLGYWKRPALTAERFIPDPFSTTPGATLYRTGDLARRLDDGSLEHLGRLDFQVKIRGFRIELGEIESNITNHPAVREAVVVVREETPGDQRLVAYVVPRVGEISAADLKQHLSLRLPPYMVPSAFVTLAALPLTPNSKIDRKALPAPERMGSEASYVAPRNPTEEALVNSWRKALQAQQVGIHDNFFELGGHSLMFARMISDINSNFKVSLGMAELIRNPTVAQFAKLIDTRQALPSKLSSLVLMQEGRAKLPVYFIYAGPGEFRAAQHMGGSHPVYGIEARWPMAWREAVTGNQTAAFPSMEQMVAPYVAELSAHAGTNPCVLAGFCYAGQIAFEAAHQFQKMGGKVESVILIDAAVRPPNRYKLAWQIWRQDWKQPADGPSTVGLVDSLGARMRSTWHTSWYLFGKVKKRVRSYFSRPVLDTTLTGVLDEQGMPVSWGLLDRLYREMEKSYVLRSLDSRGVLFRTGELDGRQIAYAPDDALGWENLFPRGVEIIPVAGHHFSIWGKQIPTIAKEINRVLGQPSPGPNDAAAIRDSRPLAAAAGANHQQ